MYKIYIVGDNKERYARWMQGKIVETIDEANLVVFTGGEDVSPDMYGEPHHRLTACNLSRDRYEQLEYNKAISKGKHIIGICRGSQLLCVLNGGRLVQHQQNPSWMHMINMYDGQEIEITSTHHQAAYPFELPKEDYKVLGWTMGISKYHEDGNGDEMNPPIECEIVYYPKTKCLGIQGHPESMRIDHLTIAYLRELLKKFVSNEISSSSKESTNIMDTQATLSPPESSELA